MSKLRVNCFSVSVDGYGAGPHQSLEAPLGQGGLDLHQWVFPTKTFQQMHGEQVPDANAGTTGIDDDFARRGMIDVGAWVLGRNMFTPSRGPWPADGWKGWWGPNPPYHVPVFVLSHYAREPLEMEGGTTFHFVTEGIEVALKKAKVAAGKLDVRLGGGVATIRQYLRAKLLDELHLAVAPVVLGKGEHLFEGIDLASLGYRVSESKTSERVLHVVFERR
ncbi:MAG TPA: dihydrofolate reductase family protein [Polyangiaceae bacterium]|nr:dihydrofolate reductase family protein [Polyangiaceae bacterium]